MSRAERFRDVVPADALADAVPDAAFRVGEERHVAVGEAVVLLRH